MTWVLRQGNVTRLLKPTFLCVWVTQTRLRDEQRPNSAAGYVTSACASGDANRPAETPLQREANNNNPA